MKSVYELILENSKIEGGKFVISFNKEMIERLFKDWEKIDTYTRTVVEGRFKTKQKYPDLNDLIAFLHDRLQSLK